MIILVPLNLRPNPEDALSEIVGFVLILALVVVASTLYLQYVVPAEGREDEIEHMNLVKDRFVSYKTSVDGLWMRSLGDVSSSSKITQGVSLSTSFDLGTGGGNTQSSGLFLSFMRPIGTGARMSITEDSGDRLTLILDGVTELDAVHLGALNYTTENYYWIQQVYAYQMGGLFLEQPNEGVAIKVAPSLSLSKVSKIAKLTLCLVNPSGERATIGGTGPLRVESRLRENLNESFQDKRLNNLTLRVDARDPRWGEAWRQVFRDAAKRSNLTDSAHPLPDEASYSVGGSNRMAQLNLSSAGADRTDVDLDLTQADLQITFQYAELG